MGIRKAPPIDTNLVSMSREPVDEIVYRRMAVFLTSCWVFLANTLLFLVRFISQHVFRIKKNDGPVISMKELPIRLEPVPEATELEEREFDGFGEEEETSNFCFKFQYQIPEFNSGSNEEARIPTTTTNVSNYQFLSEKDYSGFVEQPEAVTFRVHESFIGFVEGNTEDKLLTGKGFQQLSVESRDEMLNGESRDEMVSSDNSSGLFEENSEFKLLSTKEVEQPNTELRDAGWLKDLTSHFDKEYRGPKLMTEKDAEPAIIEPRDVILSEDEIEEDEEEKLLRDREATEGFSGFDSSFGDTEVTEGFPGFVSDSESSFSDGYSVKNLEVDSDDGFLSERDFGDKEAQPDSHGLEEDGSTDINNQTGYANFCDGFLPEREFYKPGKKLKEKIDEAWSDKASAKPEVSLGELDAGEIKESQLPSSSHVPVELVGSSEDEHLFLRNNSSSLNPEPKPEASDSVTELHASCRNIMSTGNGSSQVDDVLKRDVEGLVREQEDPEGQKNELDEEDTSNSLETPPDDLNDEELDELESLWEHQDLIEQLKMELKKVRAVGLPTILEESESPKTIEDLKPWKIDEKFLREDPMDELHKFYKSYRERMRKFDILNYQKMYAIGFLQLKDPLRSLGSQKPLISTMKSHLSQNLLPFFRRKHGNDPSEKFIKELQSDLETVYVGQTCLSWEFLRWQYEKARELPESDPYQSHHYNQVAGEFQQFQVLLQRFIENEPFQGPRLQNYVKNRCVLRNLLQVPVMKEDCLKDKKENKRKGNYVTTSEDLEDIMEESIRIFWEFVKADKDETPVILKGLIGHQVELQDPSDFELMDDIQASLQKKEKKLKDILRTGNCIVKKFKKPREDRSNQDLFFSQVDMKLLSRVLKMSRITTDQLVWCHKKLNKITFADRKIHREPSFLLFPC